MKKIVAMMLVLFLGMTCYGHAKKKAPRKSKAVQTLKISTVERKPFIFLHPDGKVTGFSADLWSEIALRNSWRYSWKREPSFPAMIKSVKSGKTHAAVANISITSEREKILDFSHPIYDSGLQIVVPHKDRGLSIFRLIWQSGALQLISAAIVVLLIIAHILWFFERNVDNPRHDYFRDDYVGGVWDAFWWAFVVMTMGGFEGEVPHSIFSRILAMFWIVVSLFFVSTLTAKITTSLTVDQLTGDIKSYRDLIGKKVGVGANSAMSKFLDVKNIPYAKYKDFKAALVAVEKGEIDATIGDAPVVRYYAAHTGRGKVRLAGPVFQADKFGIVLRERSRLLEKINTTLLEIKEDGTYGHLTTKWFGNKD